jgi:hypothetical protein
MSLRLKKSFFDIFPVPEYLLLGTSGVALSDDGIRFAEFGRGALKGELILSRYGETELEPGVISGGVITDAKKLEEALSELKKRFNIRFVRATLPEEKTYMFTATVEKVSSDNLRDAVAFIIEENVPISLSESVFDFEVIGNAPGNRLEVAVGVVPNQVAASYINVLESAGITPISFDVESLAVRRAVVKDGDKTAQLIVNLGETKTGLYIVEEGVVHFSSTPSYGAKSDGADLKAEIRKLIAFWNTRLDPHGVPKKKVEKVVVCGVGGKDEDFLEDLFRSVDIPYCLANVWTNVFTFDKEVPPIPFEDSLSYASAVGLALNAIPKHHV